MQITILEEDIINGGSYASFLDCPITRALKRAGLDMMDVGGIIKTSDGERIILTKYRIGDAFFHEEDKYSEEYRQMSEKVVAMCVHAGKAIPEDNITPIPPEDFTVDLPIPSQFIQQK